MASYQAGRTPFVTVLESLGTLYGDRGACVRLLAVRGQLRASLDEASLEDAGDMPALPAAMGGVPAMGARRWAPTRRGAMGAGASMKR